MINQGAIEDPTSKKSALDGKLKSSMKRKTRSVKRPTLLGAAQKVISNIKHEKRTKKNDVSLPSVYYTEELEKRDKSAGDLLNRY